MIEGQFISETERRRLRPYPKYKDSGVEWLGKIPARWEVKRLKRLFLVVNGSTPQSGVIDYWNGDIPWVTPEDLGKLQGPVIQTTRRRITEAGYRSCGTALVPAGSLVLSTRAPIGYLAISGQELCTNQGCRSMVSRRKLNRKFFYFQLKAARSELESWGEGSTFMELAKCKLEDIYIAEPSETEQCAIAAFLDRETAKIDALIEKKELLIELLQEKRTALITQAVTKGLDPNVPMKDSGVEWRGDVPIAWNLLRLKHIVQFLGGGTPSKDNLEYWQGDIPWVSPKDMKSWIVSDTVDKITEEAVAGSATKVVGPGTVLIVVRSGILNHTIPVALSGSEVALNQDLKALKAQAAVVPEYLAYFIAGMQSLLLFAWRKEGATVESLELDLIANTLIPLPPVSQQRIIVNYLKRETATIDVLIAKINVVIERLNEYRTALISAAVTGKIDARDIID